MSMVLRLGFEYSITPPPFIHKIRLLHYIYRLSLYCDFRMISLNGVDWW